jgi:hypothetical protein
VQTWFADVRDESRRAYYVYARRLD